MLAFFLVVLPTYSLGDCCLPTAICCAHLE
jgi:hypothetical protein